MEQSTLSMMEGALKVSTAQVRDIMIPRTQMIAVDSNEDPKDFLPRIIDSHHSRFPVINETIDQVEGILLAKDLLSIDQDNFELKSIIREPVLIPESKKLDILLDELRVNRRHMAIVIDEYGGITGLITIEDVLEEIVGEIEDEYDEENESFIKKISSKEYTVSALIPISDFNKEFQASFSDKEFDTLGGIVMNHFEGFPQPNDSIGIDNFRFTILSSTKGRIKNIKDSKQD